MTSSVRGLRPPKAGTLCLDGGVQTLESSKDTKLYLQETSGGGGGWNIQY